MSIVTGVGTRFLVALIAGCTLQFSMQLQAATLQQCEKAKLKQLQAERGGKASGKGGKSGEKGPSKRRQSLDKMDEWLWKNCGSYSYEMRRLEQERM